MAAHQPFNGVFSMLVQSMLTTAAADANTSVRAYNHSRVLQTVVKLFVLVKRDLGKY